MTAQKSSRLTDEDSANRERTVMQPSTRIYLRKNISSPHWFRVAGLSLLASGLMVIAGCGSGSTTSKVQMGPLTFTDVNGTALKTAPTTLASGQSTYLSVDLEDDPQLLGANWSVYCGSALPPGTPLPTGQNQDQSCGYFTPVHTLSGPVPTYSTTVAGYVTLYTAPATPPKQGVVTLYASATSNPSKRESVTLTINAQPIAIGFAPAPPATLSAAATAQLKAVVSNDTTHAGVAWSVICGASDWGSFSAAKTASGVATTYTAPATAPTGGSVQITATAVGDPTKAVSSTVSIM
jgi:hypothetical protein